MYIFACAVRRRSKLLIPLFGSIFFLYIRYSIGSVGLVCLSQNSAGSTNCVSFCLSAQFWPPGLFIGLDGILRWPMRTRAFAHHPHMHIIIDEYTRIIHLNYGSNSGARNASSIRKYICGRQCCHKTDAYKDTQCLENVACKR